MRRPVTLALHGVLLAALVAGPLAYVAAEKSVSIEVDGNVTSIRTYAGTVGDLLGQRSLTVGPHDELSPPANTRLSNGMHVALLRGRQVRLVVDGEGRDIWTTARTVDELTRQLGGRYQDAYLSTSRDQRIPLDGLQVDVRMPKTVDVSMHGRRTVLVTSAATWQQVIDEAGLRLGPLDLLSVPLLSAPADGQAVVVTQVSQRYVRLLLPIPFATKRFANPDLYVGTTRLVRAGHRGTRLVTWRYTLHDGKKAKAEMVASVVSVAPLTAVVWVGTKKRPAPKPRPAPTPVRHTSVDSLHWSALARCESGGNPRAVGGGGEYFGLYQFMLSTWHAVGGVGNPIDASSAEQTYRAKLLYLRSGAGAWPYCGRFL